MIIGSDSFDVPPDLPPPARQLLALRPLLVQQWTAEIRADVPPSRQLQDPILINTLPTFYDNMIEALTPGYPRATATEGSTAAATHGDERARMTGYRPEEVVREYQIFKQLFLRMIAQHQIALTPEQVETVDASVDRAIIEAISAYSVRQELQRQSYVAMLAHDMRTPLSNIGMAAALMQNGVEPERAATLSARILGYVERLDDMVSELLDIAALNSTQHLVLDISSFDLLELAAEVVREAPARNAPYQLSGQAVSGHWCRRLLRRALENLLRNACKYGAADTPIRITIDGTELTASVAVSNDGQPIPQEQIDDVFQMFHRHEPGEATGWGLGLPFVKNVAESHGGSVVIDSAEQRGTTVSINLPRDARPFVEHQHKHKQ